VPVLNDEITRRPTDLETELLKNLGLCADQLIERHAECTRHYPDFEVPFPDFRDAVGGAVAKYLCGLGEKNATPSVDEIRRFIRELRVLDLYLGLACMGGDEQAWWEFDRQHRSFIERWTRHLVRSDTDSDEVIDAVYVELFGTKVVEGQRQSKFRTYTGRGTLRGWLRTIILHAAVDLHRAPKVEIPMEDWSESGDEFTGRNVSASETEDSMLTSVVRERYRSATVAALDQALATLDDHETLLLLYYHVEGLKLREIARIVEEPRSPIRRWFQRRSSRRSRVHESTVMRWLDKVYQKISERFHAELASKHGLKPEEVEICKKIAAEDPAQTIKISPISEGVRTKEEVRIEGAS
jgi:RNA polymerase sigma-70 factor